MAHCNRMVCYHGEIPYKELHQQYKKADLGVFASSCENLPNIFLDTMASGWPSAWSKKVPMPEVLGKDWVYFDPEQPANIIRALRQLIESPLLRKELSQVSYATTQKYSWQRSVYEKFGFLLVVTQLHKDLLCAAS